MALSGKLWENGRFSIGHTRKKNPDLERDNSRAYEQQYEAQFTTETIHTCQDTEFGAVTKETFTSRETGNLGGELGLSNVTIPRKTAESRKRKGLSGISGLGKLTVQNAALRLQRTYGKSRLSFTTLTLPPLPKEILDVVTAKDFEYLEKRFREELQRRFKKLGVPFDCVGVIEIQTERYQKHGYPYPHWHLIHPSKKYSHIKGGELNNPWYVPASWLRSFWQKLVRTWMRSLKTKHDLTYKLTISEKDWKASIDIQTIRKNASGYISKYITKGVETIEEMTARGNVAVIPYQWWFVTQELKAQTLNHRVSLNADNCSLLFYHGKDLILTGEVTWYFELTRVVQEEVVKFGCVGSLSHVGLMCVSMNNDSFISKGTE